MTNTTLILALALTGLGIARPVSALVVEGAAPLAEVATESDAQPASLAEHLQLRPAQIEALNRLALEREAPRAEALQVLSPVQRAQLESLAADDRVRVRRDGLRALLLPPRAQIIKPLDADTQVLAATGARSARRAAPRSTRRKGTISYGVYGGYAYGLPHYGVGANYGRGPVGVHAGIGSGGPRVGVSIGGVLGR